MYLQFNGSRVISCSSEDMTTRFWNVKSGYCEVIIEDNDVGSSSFFKSSENILLQGYDIGVFKIWDVVNKCCLLTLDGENMHTTAITGVILKYDFIITSGEDGFVKLWEFSTGKLFADFCDVKLMIKKD